MDGMLSQEEINALLSGMDTTAAESAYEAEALSDMEKDIMGEIANISMGTAATTLSSLVNQKVDMTDRVYFYKYHIEKALVEITFLFSKTATLRLSQTL